MGAQLFFLGLAGIAWMHPRRKLKMAGGAPEKSASENRRAPEHLPVEIERNKVVGYAASVTKVGYGNHRSNHRSNHCSNLGYQGS